jgi:hypothetical protein
MLSIDIERIKLFIHLEKSVEEKILTLEVSISDTVSDLKNKIWAAIRLPPHRQRLIFGSEVLNGKPQLGYRFRASANSRLDQDRQLADCNIPMVSRQPCYIGTYYYHKEIDCLPRISQIWK